MSALTVSGQLEAETFAMSYKRPIHLDQPLERKTLTPKPMLQNFG